MINCIRSQAFELFIIDPQLFAHDLIDFRLFLIYIVDSHNGFGFFFLFVGDWQNLFGILLFANLAQVAWEIMRAKSQSFGQFSFKVAILFIYFNSADSRLLGCTQSPIHFYGGVIKFISVVRFEPQIIYDILMVIANRMMFLFGMVVASWKIYNTLSAILLWLFHLHGIIYWWHHLEITFHFIKVLQHLGQICYRIITQTEVLLKILASLKNVRQHDKSARLLKNNKYKCHRLVCVEGFFYISSAIS